MDELDNGFGQFSFKAGSLARMRLPQGSYPLRLEVLEQAADELSIPMLVRGLMDWLDVACDLTEPSRMLRAILDEHVPREDRPSGRCVMEDEHGHCRIFHVGDVDCTTPRLVWQRSDWVFASATPASEEGRMMVVAVQPLSLATAQSIFAHAILRDMGGEVDSIQLLAATRGRTGNFYGLEAGRMSIALRTDLPATALAPLAANQLAWLVAVGNDFI